MFDSIDRPDPEQRLRRILVEGLGDARSPAMRHTITAAADQLQVYSRERHEHKHGRGPAPRLSLLTSAHELVAEAGRMNRSMRESRGGPALADRLGIDVALVTDELWQASDAIGRWIEYERTRWSDR